MNYSHPGWKCSDNDNGMSKRNELSSEITEDEADVDRENEDEESRADVQRTNINNEEKEGKTEQDDTQIGECAICHVIINDINFNESVDDSGQNPYESYLLCQRCVRKFSIQSGQ